MRFPLFTGIVSFYVLARRIAIGGLPKKRAISSPKTCKTGISAENAPLPSLPLDIFSALFYNEEKAPDAKTTVAAEDACIGFFRCEALRAARRLGLKPCRRTWLLFFVQEGFSMETRVALIGIIVEQEEAVMALNQLLHQFGRYIIGRMGLPYRQRGVNVISVVVDAPQPVISELSGKIGRLPGVSAKTLYSNVISTAGERKEGPNS